MQLNPLYSYNPQNFLYNAAITLDEENTENFGTNRTNQGPSHLEDQENEENFETDSNIDEPINVDQSENDPSYIQNNNHSQIPHENDMATILYRIDALKKGMITFEESNLHTF